jgi:hypothetical protein
MMEHSSQSYKDGGVNDSVGDATLAEVTVGHGSEDNNVGQVKHKWREEV